MTNVDMVPDHSALLQTSLENVQGDLSRLDHELISERLDRLRINSNVIGLGCEFRSFAEGISSRVEKLETTVHGCCGTAGDLGSAVPLVAAAEKVVEVSTWSKRETVAVGKVCLQMEPTGKMDMDAGKTADYMVAVAEPTLSGAGSPSRRARLGRQ